MFPSHYDDNLQFFVPERSRRSGSYSLAEYVSVVSSSLRQQQLALFGWSCLWEYQVDTARNRAGGLVEHENRQGRGLHLDSGRSLGQVFVSEDRWVRHRVGYLR